MTCLHLVWVVPFAWESFTLGSCCVNEESAPKRPTPTLLSAKLSLKNSKTDGHPGNTTEGSVFDVPDLLVNHWSDVGDGPPLNLHHLISCGIEIGSIDNKRIVCKWKSFD